MKKIIIALSILASGCNNPEGASNTISGSSPNAPTGGLIVDSSTQIAAVSAINITSAASPQNDLTASQNCSAGTLMTSGGCRCLDDVNYAGRVKASYPSGNGWVCECVNSSGFAANHKAVAHVVCMTPTFKTALAP